MFKKYFKIRPKFLSSKKTKNKKHGQPSPSPKTKNMDSHHPLQRNQPKYNRVHTHPQQMHDELSRYSGLQKCFKVFVQKLAEFNRTQTA